MAKFFFGQRIKKSRGECDIGITATVIGYTDGDDGYTLMVRQDRPWKNVMDITMPADAICLTIPDLWEPILDKHEPCESEFRESLDQLLASTEEEA